MRRQGSRQLRWLVVLACATACQRHTPPPPPAEQPTAVGSDASAVGVPACDDYLRRVAACTKLTPAARDTFARGGAVWRRAATAPGASSKEIAETCASVAKLAEPELAGLGC